MMVIIDTSTLREDLFGKRKENEIRTEGNSTTLKPYIQQNFNVHFINMIKEFLLFGETDSQIYTLHKFTHNLIKPKG